MIEIILPFIAIMTTILVAGGLIARGLKVKEARLAGDTDGKVRLLTGENRQLREQLSYLEDRVAVLERIATDPAARTAHEIERLR
jgi:hypothetical protein